MEFVYSNLLSADEIRAILKQRQLIIPDLDQMNYEQLVRIFNNFVVPMNRRNDRRYKMSQETSEIQQNKLKLKRALTPPVNECASKLQRVTLNVNVENVGEPVSWKRKNDSIFHTPVTVTPPSKRVKITWP